MITVDLFKSWADLERVAKLPVPRDTDVVTKGEYLLKHLRRRSKTLADRVSFTPHELACGFCSTKNELLFCLRYLADRGGWRNVQAPIARDLLVTRSRFA